jgi:pyruvate/2-oxoglutarate dehydrogenase complex dihydrolipoamide dehydrogenase (E3) component
VPSRGLSLPSKNELWSARIAHLARNATRFGTLVNELGVDMRTVKRRKQDMIDREVDFHVNAYREGGVELIMGSGRFVRPKTLEVALNEGGTRLLAGDEVVVNVGSHAAVPDIPGLRQAHALTHIEALELMTCRGISSSSAAATPASRWHRPIAASAVA